MKKINELTEDEANNALDFVLGNKYHYFIDISFKPVMKDGMQQITFSGRSIIGIRYHGDQDTHILHFDNTKMVLWLYKNGYDIAEFLQENSHYSEMESDYDNVMYEIKNMAKGEKGFREGYKHNYTLEYVQKKCETLYKSYNEKEY